MSDVYDRYIFAGVTFTREARWYFEAPYVARGGLFTSEQWARLVRLRERLNERQLTEQEAGR